MIVDGAASGWLPDYASFPQAVEELLESLDLEKSSCCMGLSRVSAHRRAVGSLFPGDPGQMTDPPILPAQLDFKSLSAPPLLSLAPQPSLSHSGAGPLCTLSSSGLGGRCSSCSKLDFLTLWITGSFYTMNTYVISGGSGLEGGHELGLHPVWGVRGQKGPVWTRWPRRSQKQ
jgi:hypothetical protein